jgi:inner membrane protein involved in colicin E2 resistance
MPFFGDAPAMSALTAAIMYVTRRVDWYAVGTRSLAFVSGTEQAVQQAAEADGGP